MYLQILCVYDKKVPSEMRQKAMSLCLRTALIAKLKKKKLKLVAVELIILELYWKMQKCLVKKSN